MIKLPPSVGMLLSLIAGVAIGAYGMNLKHDSAQLEADSEQVAKDDEKAANIDAETALLIDSNPVSTALEEYEPKVVKVPRDLTDEEIDNLCVNRYIPDNVMQPVRDTISEAWQRFNDLQANTP